MTAIHLLKNPLLSRDLKEGEEREFLQSSDLTSFELLLLGCRTDSILLVQQALNRGAQVNQRDRESWTPLMHASYHNSYKVIPLLIAHRAVPYLRDDQGDSPLDIARDMDSTDSLSELDRALEKSRLKQAGLFLQSLITLIQEKKKAPELRSNNTMALCYIDLGYGWWLSEERLDKTFQYFNKASQLAPRVGAFPYATLLASCGYYDEAMGLLFRIARRGWGSVSPQDMANNQAFFGLREHPEWQELLNIWPRYQHRNRL